MCLTKLLHSGPEQQESGLLTLLRDGCLCSLSLPLVFCSMMGNLTATSPATLPSLGQKVSFLFCCCFFCVYTLVSAPHWSFTTFACVSGVNIGGAGSYVYDNPVNEAPAAVSMETDGKPEEEKKAPARGPVKGEKYV